MIGTTLSHYRVLEKLGAGGMGEVYRAEDTTLGRHAAIRVLPGVFQADAERLGRFERETQPQARRKPWHAVLSSSHEVGSPAEHLPDACSLGYAERSLHKFGAACILDLTIRLLPLSSEINGRSGETVQWPPRRF